MRYIILCLHKGLNSFRICLHHNILKLHIIVGSGELHVIFDVIHMACHCGPIIKSLHVAEYNQQTIYVTSYLHPLHKNDATIPLVLGLLEVPIFEEKFEFKAVFEHHGECTKNLAYLLLCGMIDDHYF
jgi:hypothetical protein